MPYSSGKFDKEISEYIKKRQYKKYLDIGAGAGKYGKIIRNIIQGAYIEAIEGEKSYIDRFNLNSIYDKVYPDLVENFFDKYPKYTTDMAIIGDCIEHLKKSDGINLINELAYRTKEFIVVFPSRWVQWDIDGVLLEIHRSVWSEKDFYNFDYIFKSKKDPEINMVIVKGYL